MSRRRKPKYRCGQKRHKRIEDEITFSAPSQFLFLSMLKFHLFHVKSFCFALLVQCNIKLFGSWEEREVFCIYFSKGIKKKLQLLTKAKSVRTCEVLPLSFQLFLCRFTFFCYSF